MDPQIVDGLELSVDGLSALLASALTAGLLIGSFVVLVTLIYGWRR